MRLRLLTLLAASALVCGSLQAGAQSASSWVNGHGYRLRLIAGSDGAGGGLYAGLQVELEEGWKTYWRSPGDGGGVPPHFDWSASANLASAKVLYPAPARMSDAAGDSVGYKKQVVFPISLEPADAEKPLALNLSVEFGVCREICVPAEAKLSLTLPAGKTLAMSGEIARALAHVPRPAGGQGLGDPRLVSAAAELSGAAPRLVIEVAGGGEGGTIDLFVEGPDGIYIPLPRRVSASASVTRFEVDLAPTGAPRSLAGKPLKLTMTSPGGASEAVWVVQ